ncbi:Membrane protein involved in the export of O-antigen and teichoic acid [Micromonospora avicenniae]|uniref:Membrane protein involved in the export of O-antigen and teichoic acid n=2 Tax=Micromonospora avicenniae TaxID=1198245 RepID=A0A1N6X270_9ACTN|nr:Membrane protein involved in the export of O-antigen and teichoic acid [Micromonospora avicenniae]
MSGGSRHTASESGSSRPTAVLETPDSDERDGARSRRLLSGILTAAVSRGAGMLVPLFLIPVMLSYLGPERYGLWTAVLALAGMAAFADLGLGNGLMTKLARCYSSGDKERARGYISSAYCLLVPMALGVCGLLWLVGSTVPWSSLLGLPATASATEARGMVLICLSAFVLNIPLSLVARVQYAYQQVAVSNLWQTTGNLLALPLVLFSVWAELSPVTVVAASVVGPLIANAANSIWLYLSKMPEVRPRLGHVDLPAMRNLLRLGGLFFLLTIVTSIANSADNLIIAHTRGLQAVTEYAVPAKVLAQAGMLVSLVNVPLWPANGEALNKGDLPWVRSTVRRMTLISTAVAMIPAILLVSVGDRIFAAWLPTPLGDDRWLLAGLAAWWVLLAGIGPRFMVQNAAGVVRPQLVGWAAFLMISLVLKWYGSAKWGIAAVPLIAVAVYAITVLPAALHGYRAALRVSAPRMESLR